MPRSMTASKYLSLPASGVPVADAHAHLGMLEEPPATWTFCWSSTKVCYMNIEETKLDYKPSGQICFQRV